MQFGATRRPGKTYGKTNRGQLVHDLFGNRSSHENASTITSSSESPTISANDVQPEPIAQNVVNLSEDEVPEHEPSYHPLSQAVENAKAFASNLQFAQDASMFDIDSSGDDDVPSNAPKVTANKRRRIVRHTESSAATTSKCAEAVPLRSRRGKPASNKLDTESIKREQNVVRKTFSKNSVASKINNKASRDGQTWSRPLEHSKDSEVPLPVMRITRDKGSKLVHVHDEDADVADHSTTDVSEYLSGTSRHPSADRQTNLGKRKSSPIDADPEISSPVQAGFSSLKIGVAGLNPTRPSPDPVSDASSTYRVGRRRLVDRLDAPSEKIQASEDRMSGASSTSTAAKTQKGTKTRGGLDPVESKKQHVRSLTTTSGESDDAPNRTTLAAKPRTTYATQRSHLSDMIDDIDTHSVPSSQITTDDILLHPVASNIASQLELEDEDSNDEATGSKLKSIHELRQAGANNRFDREIDVLLEDIDTVDQAFKAIRLQALVKLGTKLQDPDFLQHLASSGRIRRLVSMPDRSIDLPTATLLVTSFALLARSEDVTLEVLKQMFKTTVQLAPQLLSESRPLSRLAKERRQNLSKAMIHTLVEFERTLPILKDRTAIPDQICPDAVALDCLEYCLRRLIQRGDASAIMSASVCSHVLRILSSEVQYLESDNHGSLNLPKLEAALSLLELCSLVVDDADVRMQDGEYKELGDVLSTVVLETRASVVSLERNALRVVVSLSNNKPRMCRLLSSTGITKVAFGIINENFPTLARQAENETVLDESKLDSVVLALGCLLNFAECDSTLRDRLSKEGAETTNPVTQLVTIFNSQVSKVDEATTKEQSQVSVAFGYLSMLLCTLSLHPVIRNQITRLLKDQSFNKLCNAAEKFFGHLRTLEHISEDDAAMSTFTARFGAILRIIKDTGA